MGDADVDEKWSHYPETVLEFCVDPPARVDLRRPVDADARAELARLGLDAPFAVVTAENPEGDNAEDEGSERDARREEARNDHRTGGLLQELERRRVSFVRVDGVSPDGRYRERCVAARLTRPDAVALARDFAQLALFWFDGDRFWLMPAEVDREPRPVPARR